MSITDELREWAEDNTLQDTVLTTYPPQHVVHGVLETLFRIADRIDAEHERLMQEQPFTIDMVPMTDESMAEHGWVRLPKDADGKYIRIGDMLMDGLSQSFTPKKVKMLMLEGNEWMLNFGGGWCAMKNHEWHHYHAPTVEDVLREMAVDWDCAADGEDKEAVLKEYAAKLRLADGKEQ